MINKINIKNYRGISNLQLSDLMPINILLGDNNCGKTSVLEVIKSAESAENIVGWSSLLRRNMFVPRFMDGMSVYEGFLDLFNVDKEEKYFEYEICGDEYKHVVVKMQESIEELTEAEYQQIMRQKKYDDSFETVVVNKIEYWIYVNDTNTDHGTIYDGQPTLSREKKLQAKGNKSVFVSATKHVDAQIYLHDILNDPKLYQEMLSVLKIYDSGIMSINYDRSSQGMGTRGVYKILSENHAEALPLNVYGDGMKKAILLMSAVIKARGGILLLDEFETAIHTSAMKETFRWILETCKKLNVQIFMTTHSIEAISKVLTCSEEILEDMAVYTLYKNEANIKVRRLDGKTALEAKEDMGLELR